MPERVPVRSTRTGGTDYVELATPDEAYVEGLRRERAGYLRYGKSERAEQVAAELRRVGADVDEAAPTETVVERAPVERAVPPGKQTRR